MRATILDQQQEDMKLQSETPSSENSTLSEQEIVQMDTQYQIIVERVTDTIKDEKARANLKEVFKNEIDPFLSEHPPFKQDLLWVLSQFTNSPDLQDGIVRSLTVPQVGVYHTEGPRMISHLALITESLRKVEHGEFDETLDPRGKEIISNTAVSRGVMLKYAFLHDIAKADTLILKSTAEEMDPKKKKPKKVTLQEQEIDWESWVAMENEKKGDLYFLPLKEGKTERLPVTNISYFNHGRMAVEKHLQDAPGVSGDIKTAIENHEIAFQFDSKKADRYEEHFSQFSEAQQNFIITVCYLDNVGSIKTDGKPDMRNVNFLVAARANHQLLTKFKTWAEQNNRTLIINKYEGLRKADKDLQPADLKSAIQAETDMDLLREKMTTSGTFTPEQIEEVITNFGTNMAEVNKAIGGKNMGAFMKIKAQCEKPVSMDGFEV